jgi:hypothetical protein
MFSCRFKNFLLTCFILNDFFKETLQEHKIDFHHPLIDDETARKFKFEIRNQKSEIRNQKSEIRNQKSEIRNQKSEIRNQKSEIRNNLRTYLE